MTNDNDSKKINELKKLKILTVTSFRSNGALRSFAEQLLLWEHHELKSNELIIISAKIDLSLIPEIRKLPLLLKQSVLRKIVEDKHEIEYKYFLDLEDLLKNSPLAFESYRKANSFLIVLDRTDKNGNELIAVIEKNKEKRGIEVNEINSIHGRDIELLIKLTNLNKKRIFTNNKSKKWLLDKGLSSSIKRLIIPK
jgi:hypothetical protein